MACTAVNERGSNMIERMKFLSITGPKADIDRVVGTYLSRYEIQLENALSELKTVRDLRPYIETNPYKAELEEARELAGAFQGEEALKIGNMQIEDAVRIVREMKEQLGDLGKRRSGWKQKRLLWRNPETR